VMDVKLLLLVAMCIEKKLTVGELEDGGIGASDIDYFNKDLISRRLITNRSNNNNKPHSGGECSLGW
jgi:hypothetical protein